MSEPQVNGDTDSLMQQSPDAAVVPPPSLRRRRSSGVQGNGSVSVARSSSHKKSNRDRSQSRRKRVASKNVDASLTDSNLIHVEEVYGEGRQQSYTYTLSSHPSRSRWSANTSRARLSFLSLKSILRSAFLPLGYPHTVTPDYLPFQIFDTIQAVCSYLRGMLCTTAILSGMGVGESTASASAAALNWFLLDGLGMASGLVFAYLGSRTFGANLKTWRIFADTINDVGLTLEMVTALLPKSLFLPMLSVASVCKAACGVSAGATRAALLQHFARADNGSDLATKEGIQETFVTLVGMGAGAIIMRLLEGDVRSTWILFIALTCLHVYANWRAVCALQLTSINDQRGHILIQHYIRENMMQEIEEARTKIETDSRAPHRPSPSSLPMQPVSHSAIQVLTPAQVSAREAIVWLDADAIFDKKVGVAMHDAIATTSTLNQLIHIQTSSDVDINDTTAAAAHYLICPLHSSSSHLSTEASYPTVVVILHADSTDSDLLESYFECAIYLALQRTSTSTSTSTIPHPPFDYFSLLARVTRTVTIGRDVMKLLRTALQRSPPARHHPLSASELARLTHARSLTRRYFPSFKAALGAQGWKVNNILISAKQWRCRWNATATNAATTTPTHATKLRTE